MYIYNTMHEPNIGVATNTRILFLFFSHNRVIFDHALCFWNTILIFYIHRNILNVCLKMLDKSAELELLPTTIFFYKHVPKWFIYSMCYDTHLYK